LNETPTTETTTDKPAAATYRGTDPADPAESTPDDPAAPEQTDADPAEQRERAEADLAKLRKEAANYRRRLRETETERDQLRARVDQADRQAVEREIGGPGGLAKAEDFWLAGVGLDELRDDEGGLDSDKVRAARDAVLADHPHWREAQPDFDGGARQSPPGKPSFGAALKQTAS